MATDDAYVCTENIITPISSKQALSGTAEDLFNFAHSSHWIHIVQSFGILIARWGTLSRLSVAKR